MKENHGLFLIISGFVCGSELCAQPIKEISRGKEERFVCSIFMLLFLKDIRR